MDLCLNNTSDDGVNGVEERHQFLIQRLEVLSPYDSQDTQLTLS